MRPFQRAILTSFLLAAAPSIAQVSPSRIQELTDSFYKANPFSKGIIVQVEAPRARISKSFAAGVSDTVTNIRLRPDQPVLTASNTKTYVAATILRLQELGTLNIEQAVAELLPAKSVLLLKSAGYDPAAIRIKHLLSHSSGIDDYVNDAYLDTVNRDRRRHWTRDEQIAKAMREGKRLGAPGDTFRYADVNYLFLTEIIEAKTGKPFQTAMRELLRYKKNGLDQTWFAVLEPAPKNGPPLAHQYWARRHWDSYAFNPSWDLYGGGGIIATAADMAQFYQALFNGRIIRDSAALSLMHQRVMPDEPHHYCLGIRVLSLDGFPAYYHGGFWGTDAAYFPDLNASISTIVLERDQRDLAGKLCRMIAAELRLGR